MNNISALEAWKISSVLEDFNNKLGFLDILKTNVGEDQDPMSDDITKAMDEQKALEIRYGELIRQRDRLTGIS